MPMPPKRGVAAKKKPDRNAKYKFVDSDSDEVSPPRNDSRPPTPQQRAKRFGSGQPSLTGSEGLGAPDKQQSRAPTLPSPPHLSQPHHHRQRPTKTPHRRLPQTPQLSSTQPPTPPSALGSLTAQTARLRVTPSPQRPGPGQSTPSRQALPSAPIGEDEAMASNGAYIPPSQQRHMRACMVCSIVRTESQFRSGGCPNCESFLELAGNPEAIQDCTSQVFDGLLTVSNTSKSWVARYQRLEGYVPGVYAVQVEGVLPEDVIAAAENAGVHYVPRDGSVSEALPTDS